MTQGNGFATEPGGIMEVAMALVYQILLIVIYYILYSNIYNICDIMINIIICTSYTRPRD